MRPRTPTQPSSLLSPFLPLSCRSKPAGGQDGGASSELCPQGSRRLPLYMWLDVNLQVFPSVSQDCTVSLLFESIVIFKKKKMDDQANQKWECQVGLPRSWYAFQ